MTTGFVYAVSCQDRIKIGFSKNPNRRVSKISSDSPFPCELLGAWPGTIEDESSIHERFADLRRYGEWFDTCESLVSFIKHSTSNAQTAEQGQPRGIDILRGHIKAKHGRLKKLADVIGVSSNSILQWFEVPDGHLVEIEKATGIPRQKLRPELFENMRRAK